MSSQRVNNASADTAVANNDVINVLNENSSGSSSDCPHDHNVTARLLAPLSSGFEASSAAVPVESDLPLPLGDGFVTATETSRTSNDHLRTPPVTHVIPHSTQMLPDGTAPRANSLSRRRGGGGGGGSNTNRRVTTTTSSLVPSVATASSTSNSTVTTTSSSSLRQRSVNSGSRSETIDEEVNARGLRASLDNGMAAVRRWIRSRSVSTVSTSPHPPSLSPPRYRHADADDGYSSSRNLEDDDLIDFSSSQQEEVTRSSNSSTSSIVDDFATPHQQRPRSQRLAPSTILEEAQDLRASQHLRQRALSEPDAVRIRDFLFQRALNAPQRNIRRRRYEGIPVQHQQRPRQRTRRNSIELTPIGGAVSSSSQLSTSAAEVLYTSTPSMRSTTDHIDLSPEPEGAEISTIEPSVQDEHGARQNGASMDSTAQTESDSDRNREARARWICINRRFQLVITIVALVFSLLLFAIMVCWVVLTSAYVVSIDKSCDVPLKTYFWSVTLQLILDVFRNDIMRLFLRWDTSSNQRIPCRVITYNIAYLMYALLVLRLGIHSVFLDHDTTCRRTAPALFQSSAVFVSLSIAAWSTIVLGYLIPFSFVATLLALNGYTPSSDNQRDGAPRPFTVFSAAMSAPPGCVDQLRIVLLEEFPADYPMECCICMENFTATEVIVETECNHVFHRQCCREWLRQARTCPVCRMDIPTALENADDPEHASQQRQARGPSPRLGFGPPASRPFARNDLHHEVVSLLQILRRRERRQQNRRRESSQVSQPDEVRDGGHNQSVPASLHDISSSLEEGRTIRQYPQS